MGQEVTLAVGFLKRERHVNRTGIFCLRVQRSETLRQINRISWQIGFTTSVGLLIPTMELKSAYQTRLTYDNGGLTMHWILVGNLITHERVVIVVNMSIRVREYKLKMPIRIGTIDIDSCPTILVSNGLTTDKRYIRTAYPLTPTLNICALIVFVILGAGKHGCFDEQISICLCDMPHLLASPDGIVCIRNQTDITTRTGAQEIAAGLELRAEVQLTCLGRINDDLAVRSSRRRKT